MYLKSLCLFAPLALLASPLAYPEKGEWHFTAGGETGIDSFTMHWEADSAELGTAHGVAYAISLNQSVGYGQWFYIQAKENFSAGLVLDKYTDDVGGQESSGTPYFFDADIRAYFPVSLSMKSRISLLPQIGYGLHHITLRSNGKSGPTKDHRHTELEAFGRGPLLGMAFGWDVTQKFSFRFGIALNIIDQKIRGQNDGDDPRTTWIDLHTRRCAPQANLDMSYQLKEHIAITSSIDHFAYSTGDTTSVGNPAFLYFQRLSYKIGLSGTF